MRLYRFTSALLLFAALVLVLNACGDEPVVERMLDDAAPPPSVQTTTPAAPIVRLTDKQAAELSVQTVRVELSPEVFETVLPGTVMPSPDHYAQVSAPIPGRVARIYVHEGEPVRQGEPLLELESLEFANLAADYVQARAEAEYQSGEVARLQTLVEQKIAPRARLERAAADLTRAEAAVRAAAARLRALGISDEQMERWAAGEDDRPLLQIRAPVTGVIDAHLIDLGQSVTSYQEMLSIVNTEAVLIRGFLSPEDAPAVRPGSTVCVEAQEGPECTINTTVASVNPSVDPENRSVTINVVARTQGGWPMPGQSVRLTIQAGLERQVATLPLSAVQYDGDRAAVFVRAGPQAFELRPVEVDRVMEDRVVVSSGLVEGEEVAVSQVFSLKALSRFEQYSEE